MLYVFLEVGESGFFHFLFENSEGELDTRYRGA